MVVSLLIRGNRVVYIILLIVRKPYQYSEASIAVKTKPLESLFQGDRESGAPPQTGNVFTVSAKNSDQEIRETVPGDEDEVCGVVGVVGVVDNLGDDPQRRRRRCRRQR